MFDFETLSTGQRVTVFRNRENVFTETMFSDEALLSVSSRSDHLSTIPKVEAIAPQRFLPAKELDK